MFLEKEVADEKIGLLHLQYELQRTQGAMDMYVNLAASVQHLPNREVGRETLSLLMGQMAEVLGVDALEKQTCVSLLNREVSMEALSEIPGKIWRVLADLAARFNAFIRSLIARIMRREEVQTQKIQDEYGQFKQEMEASDKLIRDLNIDPGRPLTKEQVAKLAKLEDMLLLDSQGRPISSDQIKSDMTAIIPANMRTDARILAPISFGDSAEDIIVNTRNFIRFMQKISSSSGMPETEAILHQLISIRTEDDMKNLVNNRATVIRNEMVAFYKNLNIDCRKASTISSGDMLMGNIYPTAVPGNIGEMKMYKLIFGTQPGKVSGMTGRKMARKLPKISMSDFEEIMALRAELSQIATSLKDTLNKQATRRDQITGSDAAILKEATERLSTFSDPTYAPKIVALQNELTRYVDITNVLYSPWQEAMTFVGELVEALGILVLAIVAKENDDTYKKALEAQAV